MRAFVWLFALGCSGSAPKTISNSAAQRDAPATYRMSASGLGPLAYQSEATEDGLRAALPSLTVKTNDLGESSGVVYDVFDGDAKLFYVVPDENEAWAEKGAPRYSKTIFAIFATSERIVVDGYSWRVGRPLETAQDLVGCECWGDGEVTACSLREHLSVIFEDRCEAARDAGPHVMIGHKIGRIMWKRTTAD